MAGDHLRQETLPDQSGVKRELVIPAPLDEVWDTITGDGWLADGVELDLVSGGDAVFTSPGRVRSGWVEEASPPGPSSHGARLVFWWENEGEQASRVELVLDPEEEDATRLRVSETRPLEVLDLRGIPLPGSGSRTHGPSLLAVA